MFRLIQTALLAFGLSYVTPASAKTSEWLHGGDTFVAAVKPIDGPAT